MTLQQSTVRSLHPAITGFILLLFSTLVMTAAYAVGKLSAAPAEAGGAGIPQPMAMKSATRPAAVVAAEVAAAAPKAISQPGAPPVMAPEPIASSQLYLQVGVLEKGMAAACQEYLKSKGFGVRVMAASEPRAERVLVGPLESDAAMQTTANELGRLGFRFFARRY
jgi:cell division septation protein DedD